MRVAWIVLGLFLAGPVAADFEQVTERGAFVRLVQGKVLSRPLIKLTVTETGGIDGTGASYPVTGAWTWRNGYFCRDLFWGGDDLGYNCQMVLAQGNRIRFVSDKGSGQSADFRLR